MEQVQAFTKLVHPALSGVDTLALNLRFRNGALGRWVAVSGAIVAGVVLAIVLIGDFGTWTAPGALHHHRGG